MTNTVKPAAMSLGEQGSSPQARVKCYRLGDWVLRDTTIAWGIGGAGASVMVAVAVLLIALLPPPEAPPEVSPEAPPEAPPALSSTVSPRAAGPLPVREAPRNLARAVTPKPDPTPVPKAERVTPPKPKPKTTTKPKPKPKPKPKTVVKPRTTTKPKAAAPVKPDPNSPFILETPNVLGLKIKGSVAVIVDASAAAKPWLADVNAALVAGLGRKGSGVRVLVCYSTSGVERKVLKVSKSYHVPGKSLARKLTSLQKRVTPGGSDPLWPALDEALKREPAPDQIVYITGRSSWGNIPAQALEKLKKLDATPKFDVIGTTSRVKDPKGLTGPTRGGFRTVDTATLAAWKNQAPQP